MNNAIMLTKNRQTLTRQAITTFLGNSKFDWNLTILDDGSDYQSLRSLEMLVSGAQNVRLICQPYSTCNTAFNRNLAVYWSEHYWGRGEFLYLSDNDAYFTPSWDLFLINAYQQVADKYGILGPYRHPYHHPHENGTEIVEVGGMTMKVVSTDAVQGLGWLMSWSTWDAYGPLHANQGQGQGTNDSEDWEMCQRIVKHGLKVGSLEPHVVYNCGLTDSQGKPCIGHELIEKKAGVIYG